MNKRQKVQAEPTELQCHETMPCFREEDKVCPCLCHPSTRVGEDVLLGVLHQLRSQFNDSGNDPYEIESPHYESQLLLLLLPAGKIRRNVQVATHMPECVNPFVECAHDQVIPVSEAQPWLKLLGFTA
jgi:hypothetical protein